MCVCVCLCERVRACISHRVTTFLTVCTAMSSVYPKQAKTKVCQYVFSFMFSDVWIANSAKTMSAKDARATYCFVFIYYFCTGGRGEDKYSPQGT